MGQAQQCLYNRESARGTVPITENPVDFFEHHFRNDISYLPMMVIYNKYPDTHEELAEIFQDYEPFTGNVDDANMWNTDYIDDKSHCAETFEKIKVLIEREAAKELAANA